MPWNGSGQFNRTNGVFTGATVWDDSRVAGRTVRSDDHDTHDEDIATGMENTVTRDGQNQPTTNLPMGGFRHTEVDDAAARNDYAAAGQIQDQDLTHIVPASVGGTGDAITLSPTPAITTYTAGQLWSFIAEATNTGATTINVSSLGTRAVQKLGAALAAGDITLGDLVVVRDDGTQFQMVSPARTPVLTSGGIPLTALADGTDGQIITWDASGVITAFGPGTAGQLVTSNGTGAAPTFQDTALPRSYIAGLQISNNSTDATNDIDIAVGECRDAANTANLTVSAAIGKQIDVSWATGGTPGSPTGGLSSSLTLTNDTWYAVIAGLVSGAEEIGFDTSSTGANLVTDHSFTNTRRIGWVRRGTATNLAFIQDGDRFDLDVPVQDFNGAGVASAVSQTVTAPPSTEAILSVAQVGTTTGLKQSIVSPLDITDTAPGGANLTIQGGDVGGARNVVTSGFRVRTDSSSQIRKRDSVTTLTLTLNTYGWIDRRGRDD